MAKNEEVPKGVEEAGVAAPRGIFGRILIGFAKNLLSSVIIKPLTTFVSVLFMWTFHAIMRLSSPEGKRLIKKIQETYYTPPDEWIEWVASYIEDMTGTTIDTSAIKGLKTTAVTSKAMDAFSKTIMQRLLHTIITRTPADMESGLDAASRFMSVNLQFQMGSWLLHLLGDVVSFGMFKSLKDLPNAISWSFGIGWLSWLVMGTPFQESIVTPLRWKYKSELRTSRFTPKEATQLRKQGLIDDEEWNKLLEIAGWKEEDKKKVWDLYEKSYLYTIIRDAWLNGWMSEEQAAEELTREGYSKERAKSILSFWKSDKYRDLQEKILDKYVDLYKEDVVKEEDINVLLKQLYPDPIERELRSSLIELEKHKDRGLTYSQIHTALSKKVIGVNKARQMLLNLGYSTEDTDILIRSWTK